jgi:predicted restriction endonuclease
MIADECEAAHIVPVAENGEYILFNGLLLGANIHKTFDKFLWSINPKTLMIEYKNNKNVGSIANYPSDCLVNILDARWSKSLENHWNKFMKN